MNTFTKDNLLQDFMMRRKILDRACQVIDRLKMMRYTAAVEDLFDVHRKVQDVDYPIDRIKQLNNLHPRSGPWSVEPKAGEQGIVRTVRAQKVVYCVPPKCGTTNWQRGMQVLLDIDKQKRLPPFQRKIPKPEDYFPLQLFHQPRNWPRFYRVNSNSQFNKIWAGRDPFARVFSAWHDKSRYFEEVRETFMY